MNTKKITQSEIKDLLVSSLPTRPTAPLSFGGRGYTASDMKAAFDKLPLYIIEKFNALLSDVEATDDGSLAASIPTGIGDGHSLSDLFSDVTGGGFADYLSVNGETLGGICKRLDEAIALIEQRLNTLTAHAAAEGEGGEV